MPDRTVLVVDDFEDLRSLVQFILEREGFQVLSAGDGPSAIEVASRHEGRIDVLVTDATLPGMDGFELARRVVLERPEVAVLFMSGNPYSREDLDRAAGAVRAAIQKPFTAGELTAAVNGLLDRSSGTPP